jgi:hypothetical protein
LAASFISSTALLNSAIAIGGIGNSDIGDLAFEWVTPGRTYREWLVLAAVLNDAGSVKPADAENW